MINIASNNMNMLQCKIKTKNKFIKTGQKKFLIKNFQLFSQRGLPIFLHFELCI